MNPFNFNNQNNSNINVINQYMQQAFQVGTNNFVNNICKNNPQAMNIYKSMIQSGNPVQYYLDMMAQRGMNKDQAIQFARNYGIKL